MSPDEHRKNEIITDGESVHAVSPYPEPLWTADEVAQYLKWDPETICAMVRNGALKAFKVGREWRFTRSFIEEYLIQRISNDQP
jgi:excisionase family DNA binding protein